jgi:hypothetical protein
MYLFCNSKIDVITLYSGHVCVYCASMVRCWHLVWILVWTDHPCLGVGCHNLATKILQMSSTKCFSLSPYIIPRNLCKKSPDATRTSFTMTATRCLYISCVHDSTPLWDLIDAPTTLHHVLSVCARTFTEIDHKATRNATGVQYATPWPCHVLIPWYLDHVISPPNHLVILALHMHIIIPMQIPCQSLKPISSTSHHCHGELVSSFHQ